MHQKFTTNDLNNLIRLLQCPLLPSLLRKFCRPLCSRLTYICNPNTLERVSLNMIGILIQRSIIAKHMNYYLDLLVMNIYHDSGILDCIEFFVVAHY